MSRKMTSRHCMMKDSLDMALQEILRYINAIHLTLLHFIFTIQLIIILEIKSSFIFHQGNGNGICWMEVFCSISSVFNSLGSSKARLPET